MKADYPVAKINFQAKLV